MSDIISSKRQIQPIVDLMCSMHIDENAAFWPTMDNEVLAKKVKFPILEYLASELYATHGRRGAALVNDLLHGRPEPGASVIVGKLLQLLLDGRGGPGSFGQSNAFMIEGDKWYHCDHLAERVYGHALLTQFDYTFPFLKENTENENQWVRRSVGVAAHYATKKGLETEKVQQLLELLLSRANSNNYEEQRGIGWGLKTIAKFHPELMRAALATKPPVARPIQRKIEVGFVNAAKRA